MKEAQNVIALEDKHILWDLPSLGILLGMSKSGVYAAMKHDGFPKPIRIGRRASRWRKSDVLKWIDSRPQGLEHEVQ